MRRVTVVAVALLAAAPAAPAAAEEAKTAVSASMLLSIMAAPTESRQAAYDRSLTEDGPPPAGPLGVVQPDGSVRYGRVTVTVKNPCPPGTPHYEPPPLPGRRGRN